MVHIPMLSLPLFPPALSRAHPRRFRRPARTGVECRHVRQLRSIRPLGRKGKLPNGARSPLITRNKVLIGTKNTVRVFGIIRQTPCRSEIRPRRELSHEPLEPSGDPVYPFPVHFVGVLVDGDVHALPVELARDRPRSFCTYRLASARSGRAWPLHALLFKFRAQSFSFHYAS